MANLLIVDDELGMRQFLTHLFQREGHVVRVAENGRDALEQLHQQAPGSQMNSSWSVFDAKRERCCRKWKS